MYDYLDPCHQVTLVSPCMQHVSTCLNTLVGFSSPWCEHVDMHFINRSETLPVCHSTPNAKLCQIFTGKMRHPHCCILTLKSWREYHLACYDTSKAKRFWISTPKLRRNITGFFCWNLAMTSNILGKHRSGPHLFRNQTSKRNTFKAPKANVNSLFSIANVLKLWFFQNKGLSSGRHYGVPNTCLTHN